MQRPMATLESDLESLGKCRRVGEGPNILHSFNCFLLTGKTIPGLSFLIVS